MPMKPFVCLGLQQRNDGYKLFNWISHHKEIGFDQFLIVDDDSDDGSQHTIRQLSLIFPIKLIKSSGRYSQLGNNKNILSWSRLLGCTHLSILDTDEFLIGDVRQLILTKKVVYLPWYNFVNDERLEILSDIKLFNVQSNSNLKWVHKPFGPVSEIIDFDIHYVSTNANVVGCDLISDPEIRKELAECKAYIKHIQFSTMLDFLSSKTYKGDSTSPDITRSIKHYINNLKVYYNTGSIINDKMITLVSELLANIITISDKVKLRTLLYRSNYLPYGPTWGTQPAIEHMWINDFLSRCFKIIDQGDCLEWGRGYMDGVLNGRCKKKFIFEFMKIEANYLNGTLLVGDILNPPIIVQFDNIIMTQVLEHVKNPILAFENTIDMLKIGGHLIITIPHITIFHPVDEICADYYRFTHCFCNLLVSNKAELILVEKYGDRDSTIGSLEGLRSFDYEYHDLVSRRSRETYTTVACLFKRL